MREALFIKKNKEKWEGYQSIETKNPDELAERFSTIVDDVAYAKTFYPKSKVTTWLNGLGSNIYLGIYKNKREGISKISKYWFYELPLLMHKYWKVFFFTFLAFSLITALAAFVSMQDEKMMVNLVGSDYVSMTKQNIKNGDPFKVYAGNPNESKIVDFLNLSLHNIQVSLLAFLGFGIYTLKIMWQNGLMLGSFFAMFFRYNLGGDSLAVIGLHGVVEISMITISSACSFVMLNSIFFPGTESRWGNFKKDGKNAVKIMLAVVPLLFFAGFFEIFVTYNGSQFLKNYSWAKYVLWTFFILASFFIIFYFFLYPLYLHKKGYKLEDDGLINKLNLDSKAERKIGNIYLEKKN